MTPEQGEQPVLGGMPSGINKFLSDHCLAAPAVVLRPQRAFAGQLTRAPYLDVLAGAGTVRLYNRERPPSRGIERGVRVERNRLGNGNTGGLQSPRLFKFADRYRSINLAAARNEFFVSRR